MLTLADKKQFAVMMHKMGLAYDKEISSQQMAIYFEGLIITSLESLSLAVNEAIKREKRLPTIAQLLEYENNFRKTLPSAQSIPRYSLADVQPQSDFGKESMQAMKDLFDGKIDKKEYLTKAFRLVDKYNRPKEECLWIDEQWNEIPV